MTEEKAPDFDNMTMFELFKYESESKEEPDWDEWFKAVESNYPFEGIHDSIGAISVKIDQLEAKFNRLIDALDKTGIKFDVTLKEWMKK